MAIVKRIFLFLLVNFAVVAFISFLLYLFNIQPYLSSHGINFTTLALFCLIWGSGGAFISLLLSKNMAKSSLGVKTIDPNTLDPNSKALLSLVHSLSEKAGLPNHPEVGLYESTEANAFATGATKSNSLVAVSTGLLRRMNSEQVEGVLGHEVTHIANGDMVTMTLLQGIINSFVMFLARAIAFVVSRGGSEREDGREFGGGGISYLIVSVLEMVFMFAGTLIVAAFSRKREFRADFGGARLAGAEKMISALNALKRVYQIKDERTDLPAYQTLKISNPGGIMSWFATHPPLDERIARLKAKYKIQ